MGGTIYSEYVEVSTLEFLEILENNGHPCLVFLMSYEHMIIWILLQSSIFKWLILTKTLNVYM